MTMVKLAIMQLHRERLQIFSEYLWPFVQSSGLSDCVPGSYVHILH